MSEIKELDCPAFLQIKDMVEGLMSKGYVSFYKDDLYVIDRNLLLETAVPGAEYIYTVKSAGTHLNQIKLHPISTSWAEAAVNSAVSACDAQKQRFRKSSEVCEFALTMPDGDLIFVNPDYFTNKLRLDDVTLDKTTAMEVGTCLEVMINGEACELSRIRAAHRSSRLFLTEDWDDPADHRVYHVVIMDDLSASIREITPKDAKHLLIHPSHWEVRKLEGAHRTSTIGSEMVITCRGEEVAAFHLSSHNDGVLVDARLEKSAISQPELIPPLVKLIKDEVTLQQSSLFFTIKDAVIDQKPLDDVLADALAKVYKERVATAAIVHQSNEDLLSVKADVSDKNEPKM